MRTSAIAATRQLAKRQLTWLRREQNLIEFYAESPSTPQLITQAVVNLLT
jgi:tRNA A37 N6-isopentenylltransferase MiaA